MSTQFRKIVSGILAAVLVLVAAIFIYRGLTGDPGTSASQSDQYAQLQRMMDVYKDSTRFWKNQAGISTASKEAVEGSIRNMAHVINVDSLAQSYETKLERLESYISVISQGIHDLKQSGGTEIVYRDREPGKDTFPRVRYMAGQFKSPYYTANVRLGDSAYLRLTSIDTTTILTKRAYRGGIFNRQWYTQVDVRNADTSRHVTTVGAFIIDDDVKKSSFQIDAQGGWTSLAGNTPFTGTFYGGEASYTHGRFTLSGEYRKFITPANLNQVSARLKLRLIKF